MLLRIKERSGVTAAIIQYHYDADDRLVRTFVGAKGDAAVRTLSPAGNPTIQQERIAP